MERGVKCKNIAQEVTMQSSPRYLIIPERGRRDIETLLSLSAPALQVISENLASHATLKTDEPSYQLIAREADIAQVEAVAALNAIMNLPIQRQRYKLSHEQILDDLKAICPEKVKALDDESKEALSSLLSVSETDEGYVVEKAEELKYGFAPHIVSIRSICDARPVFNKDRTEIAGMLLIASLGITTHDENHEDQTLILQMTKKDLQKLRESIGEAERKLGIMEEGLRDKFNILS
jgi:hypothetical protein